MAFFTADQIVGKKLWAKKVLYGHSFADSKAPILKTIPKDTLVGWVFSWVEPSAGNVWWAISTTEGGEANFYVKHAPGNFNYQKLIEQLPPELIPNTALEIPTWAAGGVGLTAYAYSQEVKDPGQRAALRLAAYGSLAYILYTEAQKLLGKIDFNPFD